MSEVTLTKEECYCDIPELYDIIATKLGHRTTGIRYDCRKVCVSKPVMEQVFAFYETERKVTRMAFNQLWLNVGPKANLAGDDYKADIQKRIRLGGRAMKDYSYCNAAFVEGLKAFLDYTTPHAFDNEATNGLVIRRRLRKGDFEKRCIQRWAISELMDSIMNNPQDPVEETTYKLALKLLSFEVVSTNASMRKVFHIAAEFIDKEVIGLFRTKEGIYP